MRVLTTLALVLSALVSGGCGRVPLSTMATLATLDTNAVDPAGLGAAVRAPVILKPRPGGVKLIVTYATAGAGAVTKKTFVMEEVREPAELQKLVGFRRSGQTVAVFRLSAADAQAMRIIQASTRAPAGSLTGTGSIEFGISADACRLGPLPAGPILSSTYLKVAAGGAYLPVIEDIDLRAEIGEPALAEHVPPCEGG